MFDISDDYIDWDDAFDNAGYVKGSADFFESRMLAAEQFRSSHNESGLALTLDLAYGAGDRQCLDLFSPASTSKGLVIFVHGGYWHKFDKNAWSDLSVACLKQGWSVAIPSYTLAPQAQLTQMAREVTAAVTLAASKVAGPIRLVGHSAGGQLISRLICEDSELNKDVQTRIDRIVPVSGLYDLRPLLATGMNQTLRLNQDEAVAQSPVFSKRLPNIAVHLWVGCEERPEFLRQTRMLCERWSSDDGLVHASYEDAKNHFSVVEGLLDENSALIHALLGN